MPLWFLCLVNRLSRLSDEDDDSDDDDEDGDDGDDDVVDDNNEYNGGCGCGDDCVEAGGGDGTAGASGSIDTDVGGKSIPMISIQLWLLFSLNDKFEAALQPPDDDDGSGDGNTVDDDDVDVTIGGTIVSGTRWGVRLEIGGSIGLVGHWYDGVVADGTLLKK